MSYTRFSLIKAYGTIADEKNILIKTDEEVQDLENHGHMIVSVSISHTDGTWLATIAYDLSSEPMKYSFWDRVAILFTGKPA